ncbi:MAG: DUF2283 domain-containing protein [Spirochaetota bacterium]
MSTPPSTAPATAASSAPPSSARGFTNLITRTHARLDLTNRVAVTIVFQSDRRIRESDEADPGVLIDYDDNGKRVSIEVLNASKRFEDLESVQYEKTPVGR